MSEESTTTPPKTSNNVVSITSWRKEKVKSSTPVVKSLGRKSATAKAIPAPLLKGDSTATMKYIIECYSDLLKLACISLHEIENGITKDPKETARISLLTITKVVNHVMDEIKS
jgi:hypothetical protein